MKRSILLRVLRSIIATTFGLASVGLTDCPVGAQTVHVRGQIFDSDSDRPVAVRLYLQSSSDRSWLFPRSASASGTAIAYKKQAGSSSKSIENHVTLSAHPFEVELAPGHYRLRVERGKEYVPFDQTIEITPTNTVVNVSLKRWINMSEAGWYSGDTHSHRALEEVPNLVLAEDLNIAFPLSYWVTVAGTGAMDGNRVKTVGVKPDVIEVDPTHYVYPLNTEYELFRVGEKAHTLGAFVVIGQQQPINDPAPPVRPIAKRVHAEGALIDLEKHSWPWSIAIVPLMNVDLFELANNHVWQTEFGFPKWTLEAAAKYMNLQMSDEGFTEWGWIEFGFQTYYALLNCGFRLQPTAGTASGVHPVPLGFGRVYVQMDKPFTYSGWLEGLRSGRSFVTNGPLMNLKWNDRPAGHIFRDQSTGSNLRTHGTLHSLSPIERVELIVNGRIVRTLHPKSAPRTGGGFDAAIDETVSIETSGWMVVRAFESQPRGRIRFAHSSPVHFEVAGRPLLPTKDQIEYLVGRVEQELARSTDVLNPEAIAEYRDALGFYRELAKRVSEN